MRPEAGLRDRIGNKPAVSQWVRRKFVRGRRVREEKDFPVDVTTMGSIHDRGLAVTNDARKREVEPVEVEFRVLHEDRYAGRSAEPDRQTIYEYGREL